MSRENRGSLLPFGLRACCKHTPRRWTFFNTQRDNEATHTKKTIHSPASIAKFALSILFEVEAKTTGWVWDSITVTVFVFALVAVAATAGVAEGSANFFGRHDKNYCGKKKRGRGQ